MRRLVTRTGTLLVLVGLAAAPLPAQQPGGGDRSIVMQAESLARAGKREDAERMLAAYLATQRNDGKAWLLLGRLYLESAERWHAQGHTGSPSGPILLDYAALTLEPAQQLLTDSGNVYRVMVEVERTTNRIEEVGWERGLAVATPAEDLPLPPVLRELGKNIIASCPNDGVVVGQGLVETTSIWGIRLLAGSRPDLLLIRPDFYATDARYRAAMARSLGADSTSDLPTALRIAGRDRPICLAPSVDTMLVPGFAWHPVRMAEVAGRIALVDPGSEVAVFELARLGADGSVWSSAVQAIYDAAARRNRGLCSAVFNRPEAQGIPPIPACHG